MEERKGIWKANDHENEERRHMTSPSSRSVSPIKKKHAPIKKKK